MSKHRSRRRSIFVFERAASYRWQHTRLRTRAAPVVVTFVEPTSPPGTRLKRMRQSDKYRLRQAARAKAQGQ